MAVRATQRPVLLASYGGAVRSLLPTSEPRPVDEALEVPAANVAAIGPSLRDNFPTAGAAAYGGSSDGYCFTITFASGRLEGTYAMLREFLKEQGYGSVAIPADVGELRAFRLPPKLRHQLSLFGNDGYVHNPLKILFPPPGGKRGALLLELYNEAAEGHLLRFHGRIR